MADQPQSGAEKKKKPEGWNIRPFAKDLRIACQTQATKEDMYDYEWVQKVLRNALGLPSESPMVDSAHESGQGPVRRSAASAGEHSTKKDLGNKGREKEKGKGA
jgi:hypothetical protein